MKSLQGQFLIASPELGDPNFYKGVVLMIKHDEEGAFGLILNRPTDNTVGEVWKMVSEEEVVEMGRELGVRPEYVREALRLRRRVAEPAAATQRPPDVARWEPNPTGRVARGDADHAGSHAALGTVDRDLAGRDG